MQARRRPSRSSRSPDRVCAAQPEIAWPRVSGVASCKWVRPTITTFENAFALASSVSRSCPTAGSRNCLIWSDRGDVHDGREHVVRRLAVIDVVVGVDRLLRSDHAAGDLDGPVGDHLVGVHVGLRAGPGLKHDQRKLIVELAVDHLFGGANDEVDLVLRQLAEFEVRQRRAFLEEPEGANHRPAPAVPLDADGEILPRPLGLRAPEMVRRHPHFAERVLFDAKLIVRLRIARHLSVLRR